VGVKAENLRLVVVFNFLRPRAKAVLPPQLWPASANLPKVGFTFGGRNLESPPDSQFVIAAA